MICVLALLTIGLSMETYEFVKTNTGVILWDYQIACDAFSSACEKIEEGEMTDEEIALELADKAFKPIWQTRDLTKPLLVNSKWYSHNLYDFLFECLSVRSLSDKEIKVLIDQIPDISAELNKIQWGDLRTNESLAGGKHEIFETIQHIDKALSDIV